MPTSVGFQLEGGRIPNERIATEIETTDSATFQGTETQVWSIIAPLVSGRTYRVRTTARWQSSTAGDRVLARIRGDSSAGGLLQAAISEVLTTGSFNTAPPIEVEFPASSTGDKTFVLTGERFSGSGNVNLDGSSTAPIYFYVDYIRG